jgi:hypothetical protein
MGVTTNGELSFGIKLDEETPLPWFPEHEEFDGIEEWWRCENGYKPKNPIWDAKSGYIAGVTQVDIDAWYDDLRTWDKENPLPIELVDYQHCDCSAYILACPGTVYTANRGYPVTIEPLKLMVVDAVKAANFHAFVGKYFPEHLSPGPKWYLSSYSDY